VVLEEGAVVDTIHFAKQERDAFATVDTPDVYADIIIRIENHVTIPVFTRDATVIDRTNGTKICTVEQNQTREAIWLCSNGILEEIKITEDTATSAAGGSSANTRSDSVGKIASEIANECVRNENETPIYEPDGSIDSANLVETGKDIASVVETAIENMPWDGSIAQAFESGTGTRSDPYIIKTAAQLALLSHNVYTNVSSYDGTYFRLDGNINLGNKEWTPIGSKNQDGTTRTFKGYFDGNNKVISNLRITTSLTEDGKVKFGSGKITTTDNKIGLFGYVQHGISNLTIKNAYIDGSVLLGRIGNAAGETLGATGAFIGNTKEKTTLENLSLTGSVIIKGNKFVGGIIGYDSYNTYKNCQVGTNDGDSITIIANSYVGGIVGSCTVNSTGDVVFEDCEVGSINSTIKIEGIYCVGGIGGAIETKDSSTTTLTNCKVIGDRDSCLTLMESNNCLYFVGGLFGKLGWGSGTAVISNCETNIAVDGSKGTTQNDTTGKVGVAGGLVGAMVSSATIENCVISGAIVASDAAVLFAGVQYETNDYSATGIRFEGSVNGKIGSEAVFAPDFMEVTASGDPVLYSVAKRTE
ncbi:MAG: hypothetical protein ACI4U2_01200, partial [Christensenellaceae bacterium]